MRKGFSLIEVLVALGGVAVLAIAATSFLFSILSQRDQAVAESLAAEQVEAVAAVVGSAVRSAEGIEVEDGGKSLELTSSSECWLFTWDEVLKQIKFSRSEGTECVAPGSAAEQLTTGKTAIERANFSLIAVGDSSRTVRLEMEVLVYRPLWNTTQEFDQLFVNLVDEGGGDED